MSSAPIERAIPLADGPKWSIDPADRVGLHKTSLPADVDDFVGCGSGGELALIVLCSVRNSRSMSWLGSTSVGRLELHLCALIPRPK